MAAVVAVVAVALLGAGCGTVIDSAKLEDTTQKSLERSLHEKISAVDCPSNQAVDPGSTFTCDVTFPGGKRGLAKLEVRNKDADISIVGFKQTK